MHNGEGYVWLPTTFMYEPVFQNPRMLRVFMWYLCSANENPTIERGVEVPTGSTLASISYVARRIGLDAPRLRRTLKRIEREGMIELKYISGKLVVSICDYDIYANGPVGDKGVAQ